MISEKPPFESCPHQTLLMGDEFWVQVKPKILPYEYLSIRPTDPDVREFQARVFVRCVPWHSIQKRRLLDRFLFNFWSYADSSAGIYIG